jgi:hypothetical protein
MSAKSVARFSINAWGHPRTLFKVTENNKGDTQLRLKSIYLDWHGPPRAFERSPLVTEQRYSIHPSLDSPDHNVIKQTRTLEDGTTRITRHLTKAIKSGTHFAFIYCRRCNHLKSPDYVPHKALKTEISLGEFDPKDLTLAYAVIAGARGKKFDFDTADPICSDVNTAYVDSSYIRLTVLWTFLGIPAHDTTRTGHFETVTPTNEDEEKAVLGLTETEISKQFAFDVMGLRKDMVEFYRFSHGDDYANYLDRCPGIFRSGLSNTAQFQQYKSAITMREISLAGAAKQNK